LKKVVKIEFSNELSKDLFYLAEKVERAIMCAKVGKDQRRTMHFAKKMQEVSVLIEEANTKIDEAVME